MAGGVTTIRTTGSIEPYADLLIKKDIDSGKAPSPHMHVTGPYLEGPVTWAPQMTELKTPQEAIDTVNFWIDRAVDNFKAYNFISREVLGAAIQAAHKRGIKVTGHLCSVGFREAAALGIDDLEHGLDVDTAFFPGKKPDLNETVSELVKMKVSDPAIQETIRDLVTHHVAVTSTLPVFELFVWKPRHYTSAIDISKSSRQNTRQFVGHFWLGLKRRSWMICMCHLNLLRWNGI